MIHFLRFGEQVGHAAGNSSSVRSQIAAAGSSSGSENRRAAPPGPCRCSARGPTRCAEIRIIAPGTRKEYLAPCLGEQRQHRRHTRMLSPRPCSAYTRSDLPPSGSPDQCGTSSYGGFTRRVPRQASLVVGPPGREVAGQQADKAAIICCLGVLGFTRKSGRKARLPRQTTRGPSRRSSRRAARLLSASSSGRPVDRFGFVEAVACMPIDRRVSFPVQLVVRVEPYQFPENLSGVVVRPRFASARPM